MQPVAHPARTCVACRTERARAELIRIVRSPAGTLSIDPDGRRPGRGAYLCADAGCVRLALRRSAIERALGLPLPPELRSRLEQGVPYALPGGTDGP